MKWVKNNSRKRAEELVMKLESGKKIGEVLAEMKISLMQARRMLERPMGQKVLAEVRALRAVPRELATGKGVKTGEEEEVAVSEEERERIMKEDLAEMEAEDGEKGAR